MARPAEGKPRIGEALRIAPDDERAARWLVSMGIAAFSAGDYTEAINWAERALARTPYRYVAEDAHLLRASSHGLLGNPAEAKHSVQTAMNTWPSFSIRHAPVPAYAAPEVRRRFAEGLAVGVQ